MFRCLYKRFVCGMLLISLAVAQLNDTIPALNATIPESDSQNETNGMHAFITCGRIFGSNFSALNTGTMDFLTDTFCSGLEPYVSCVIEGLINATTLIDNAIKGLINKDAVLPSFQNACAVRSVWAQNAACIRNQTLKLSTSCNYYFNIEILHLSQRVSPVSLCSSFVSSINCLADAFSACSSDVSNIYRSTYLNFLTQECRNGTQT
uniref:Hic22 n=1 Tax=Sinohyriopsis cumingii TaxID=165450 RepID=A0A0K2BMW1_SINCU|nr:hic22 [Sinohyriopsis cumingii]